MIRPSSIAHPGSRLLVSHALAATAMSMPWPALLAAVWADTGSETWLGLAGASRMLPYVVLSAAAGILADRLPRLDVLRWSTVIRAALLTGCGIAMVLDQTGLAVGLAVCTVAAGTPAYPAAVAVMPRLARHGSGRLTNMLVTAEVTAFVVGPAISGLIIGLGLAEWSIWAAAALAVIGWPLLHGLGHAPAAVDATRVLGGRLRAVLTSPGVPLAIAMVALVNFMEGGVSVALINLNATRWGADERGFGVATAALGFGALAAPLLIMVLRLRGSLLVTGGGFAAAGLAPTVALAVGPLAIAGAAGTAVECASTDVLQRSVPDRFRAFSLGLTDSIMVAAAMLGSLLVPLLSSGIGAPAAFVVSGVGVVAAAAFRHLRSGPARGATGLQSRAERREGRATLSGRSSEPTRFSVGERGRKTG